MKGYDNYYKTKSKTLLNVYRATLYGLINHGVLQQDANVNSALKIIDNEIELKKDEDLDEWKQEYDCVFNKEEKIIENVDERISELEEKIKSSNKLNKTERLSIESLLNQTKKSIEEYRNYSKWSGNDTLYKTVEKQFLDHLREIEKLL